MLEIARKHAHRPDARIAWLAEWVRTNMAPCGRWNDRRLVLFTEYEDTRRWVEKRLAEALDDLQADDRIALFTGATPLIRREELKRRFNSDPAQDPLRILICTDAAREGINLQMRCHDLIHIDLPWNPARLEQRNGRIDRKLQPSSKVWCRYFVYAQREEDVVLRALVRKTELIRGQLGSAGQVIGHRLSDRLEREDITRPKSLALEIDEAVDEDLQKTAVAEMDDETRARRARQAKDIDDLRETLERSREKWASIRTSCARFLPAGPRRDVPRRSPSRRNRRHAALSSRPGRSFLCVRRLAGGTRRLAHPPGANAPRSSRTGEARCQCAASPSGRRSPRTR